MTTNLTTKVQKTPVAVITIDEIRRVHKGALEAVVTATIAGKVKIHDIRVIKQEGQARWVSMPRVKVPAENGEKPKWFPIVEIIDKKLKEQISESVLAALEAERREPPFRIE